MSMGRQHEDGVDILYAKTLELLPDPFLRRVVADILNQLKFFNSDTTTEIINALAILNALALNIAAERNPPTPEDYTQ